MQNMNEVMPKKHEITKNGLPVIRTDSVDMAEAKWKPAEGEHWVWKRNGVVVKEEK